LAWFGVVGWVCRPGWLRGCVVDRRGRFFGSVLLFPVGGAVPWDVLGSRWGFRGIRGL
jgi:hypothetical protein